MKIKYRLTQPFLSLGMIIIVLLFCVVLLLFFPFILFGSFLWKDETFWKENSWYFDLIPRLKEKEEKK